MNECRLLEHMSGRRVPADSQRKDCEALREGNPSFQRALSLLNLSEPRAWARYRCCQRICYRAVSLYDSWSGAGSLQNVSRSGNRLLTREPFAPGQFLALEMLGMPSVFPRLLRMKVVYSLPAGRGSWYVAGTWLPELTREQLDAVLKDLPG